MPLKKILNTNLFSFDRASQDPMWLKEARGEHVPETEEYGISSVVYQSNKPFHPKRFFDFCQTEWSGVVRVKGFFWLASNWERMGNISQA